jgi:hypothetical protein
LDDDPLELRQRPHHLNHRISGGRRGVDSLRVEIAIEFQRANIGQELCDIQLIGPAGPRSRAGIASNWRLVAIAAQSIELGQLTLHKVRRRYQTALILQLD